MTSPITNGGLCRLRTREEVENRLKLSEAWVVQAPVRTTNNILRLVDQAVLPRNRVILAHLRRVSPATTLSVDCFKRMAAESERDLLDASGIPLGTTEPVNATSANDPVVSSSGVSRAEAKLFMLLCLTSDLPLANLQRILSSVVEMTGIASSARNEQIFTTFVPMIAPSSAEQAEQWSKNYWPAVYRSHNPFGPQPATFAKSEEPLLRNDAASIWMDLAFKLAHESVDIHGLQSSPGESVGAVVVKMDDTQGRLIAGARDARRTALSTDPDTIRVSCESSSCTTANPLAHAVMRSIGLVARKRLQLEQEHTSTSNLAAAMTSETDLQASESTAFHVSPIPASTSLASFPSINSFLDVPITATENSIYAESSLEAGGYLCTDFTLFVTHEPCVSCTMAALHSRFDSIIFGREMRWGGVRSESLPCSVDSGDPVEVPRRDEKIRAIVETPGYGLFWRKELNWRMLAWQWLCEGEEEGDRSFLA